MILNVGEHLPQHPDPASDEVSLDVAGQDLVEEQIGHPTGCVVELSEEAGGRCVYVTPGRGLSSAVVLLPAARIRQDLPGARDLFEARFGPRRLVHVRVPLLRLGAIRLLQGLGVGGSGHPKDRVVVITWCHCLRMYCGGDACDI